MMLIWATFRTSQYEKFWTEILKFKYSVKQYGEKANMLVNSTNNSWFGRSAEPLMHYRIARFRAIENRKAFVRATCTGYSSIFDPAGRALYTSGLFTKEAIVKSVPLMEIETVYSKFGWSFPYLMAAITVIMISINASLAIRKKRNTDQDPV